MENPDEHGGFINIQSWMVKKLGLKSNELIIYALIHGFSQDGRSYFYGSIKYIMENTNLSKETVLTVLQSLVRKNLIVKKDVKNYQTFDLKKNSQGSQHFCLYYTVVSREKNKSENEENHGSRNLTDTGQEFRPNNLLDNKFDTATSEKTEKENSERKKKFGILKKSEAAEGVITKELKELFGGHLVFDQEFVPEIARLVAQFELKGSDIPGYLRFAFERTSEKKPKSVTNLFYKIAKSAAVMQDFMLEKKKSEAESKKDSVTCPVCGNRNAKRFQPCPACHFDMSKSTDEGEIRLSRQIFSLPENEKQRFLAEYKDEIKRQLSVGFLEKMHNPQIQEDFRERIAEIYRKYGITA